MAKVIDDNVLQDIVNKLALIPYHYVFKILPILTALPEAPKEEKDSV